MFTTVVFMILLLSTSGLETSERDNMKSDQQDSLKFGTDPDSERKIRSDDADTLQAVVAQQAQALSVLTAKLEAAEASIISLENAQRDTVQQLQNVLDTRNDCTTCPGSVFVRWGKSTCPNGTETIYSGTAGGSWSHNSGGAANRLCLTTEPVFDDVFVAGIEIGRLYGAEYNFQGHENTDVVCAVCHTPHSATFVVPGTNICPAGTVRQYSGHLTAGNINDQAASEYLCLDADLEERANSTAALDSAYFVSVLTRCGSLQCPPYVDGKTVTCAVCSK